jgi:hypothetical protein
MSGGGQTQQSNQVSQVQLPPWVSNAAQQNYGLAQQVANRPLQQYQGQMVADVAPQQQQSWDTAATSGQAGLPQYGAAQAGYQGVLGSSAPQVQAGSLANTNLSPYMNPYTQNVINATLPIMQQNLGVQQAGNQSQAAGAGAYGGSRQAIQQGVTQAQGAMGMGQMAQQLNQANFGQAQSAAQQDIQSQLAAAQGNQNAYLQQQNLQNQAAGGMANLGSLANQNQLQSYMMQQGAGTAEQTQAQNEINAQMQKFNQAYQYPTTQMNTLLASLGMTPYGQSQTTSGQTTTQAQTDPMMSALGGLTTLGGLFSAPAGGTSAISGLMGMFSDKEAKTDIKPLGKKGGVPMYAYRYKGDPKTYPKVVGPMAQDIQKMSPSSVVSINGSKVIKPGAGMLANHGMSHLRPKVKGGLNLGH